MWLSGAARRLGQPDRGKGDAAGNAERSERDRVVGGETRSIAYRERGLIMGARNDTFATWITEDKIEPDESFQQETVELCQAGRGPWILTDETFPANGDGVYIRGYWRAFEEAYRPQIFILPPRRSAFLSELYETKDEAVAAAIRFVNELLDPENDNDVTQQ